MDCLPILGEIDMLEWDRARERLRRFLILEVADLVDYDAWVSLALESASRSSATCSINLRMASFSSQL